MIKKKISVLFVIIYAICQFPVAIAHQSEDDHYKDIESVLFGNKATIILSNADKKKMVRHLEYAASLALDQFNGYKAILLEDLKQYGVPNLPAQITDKLESGGFDFSASGQTHRQYTHLGWTKSYDEEHIAANWPLRRQMMVNTVKKILNSDNEEICDAFAAILYYIHVIGDLQNDSSRTERDQVIPLIEKRGMSDIFVYHPNKDIFIELYHYFPILFDQKINKTYKSYYTSMMRDIKNLYSRAKQTMKENSEQDKKNYDNNLTPDQLDSFSKELLNIIKKYLPTLLEQTYFQGVFY